MTTRAAAWKDETDIWGSEQERWAGLRITRGRFILNNAALVVDNPGFKVWEIDCRSKYPDAWLLSSGDEWWASVFPRSGDSPSLHLSRSGKTTTVAIPGKWDHVMIDGARYTITIVAWNDPRRTDDQQG